MTKLKTLSIIAALAVVLFGCSQRPVQDMRVSENVLGPYLTVCCECNYYDSSLYRSIDSLSDELDLLDVETLQSFIIQYNRYNAPSQHVIYGCVVANKLDSALVVKLERQHFTVRLIGTTNCMTLKQVLYPGNEIFTMKDLQAKFDEYSLNHGFVSIPNGETGLTIYRNKDTLVYAAEIKAL
ncbi:MAG: hypothetical protein MJZ61_04030 [Bacteroidales bacterium]|nr:hypothetical protein [Bacteroidales bacterium]